MILAQSDPFTTADAITLGIASIGAFTGIAALGITVSQFWLSGPRLRVEITAAQSGTTTGRFICGTDWLDANAKMYPVREIVVHAINRGRMDMSIDPWGIELGAGLIFHAPLASENPSLPVRLAAGERSIFIANLDQVLAENRLASQLSPECGGKVSGVVISGDGRTTRSKKTLRIPTQ